MTYFYYAVFNLPSLLDAMSKEEYLKALGEHIVKLRLEKKQWSQSDLARASFKDRQNIQKLEAGRFNPTAYYLKQIAEAMEIPVSQLLDF